MYTYIKKTVPGYYFDLAEMLKEEDYSNLGTTYEDFMANKFVLLSETQVAFRDEHPNASIREMLKMEMDKPAERTLEDAKRDMLSKIYEYDYSENVNSFTINGAITAWFSVQERLNYQRSVDAALSEDQNANMQFFVNDTLLEVPAAAAKSMLSQIQLYADKCFIVTKTHKLAVEKLTTIEEVDNYNFKTSYPEKLNFNLAA